MIASFKISHSSLRRPAFVVWCHEIPWCPPPTATQLLPWLPGNIHEATRRAPPHRPCIWHGTHSCVPVPPIASRCRGPLSSGFSYPPPPAQYLIFAFVLYPSTPPVGPLNATMQPLQLRCNYVGDPCSFIIIICSHIDTCIVPRCPRHANVPGKCR